MESIIASMASEDSFYVTVVIQRNSKNSAILNRSGINTYTRLLLSSLREDAKVKYEVITPCYFLSYPFFISSPSQNRILHMTSQDLALPLVFNKWKKYENVVVTVHDVIPLEYPLFEQAEHIQWKRVDKWIYKKTIEGLKNADQIITVSNAAKNSLLKCIPEVEKKCRVVYEYPEECYKKIKRKEKNREKDREKDADINILYVGSEMPHKNLSVLIDAFALIKKKVPGARLIKIGKPGWKGAREKLIKKAEMNGIARSIIWKETVENLVEEYNNAAVYVQPSLCEGFGLPIVEAMACGCPVVVSDIPVFHEIVEEAGLYFIPNSPEELASQVIMLIAKKEFHKKMSAKGLKQVKKFNKERFWKETEAVYKQII